MIINYKGKGLLMVPITHKEDGSSIKIGGRSMVRIIPGYNEILDNEYLLVRPHLLEHISEGTIEEYGRKEKRVDRETGEEHEFYVGTSIRRQTPAKAAEMAKNCYSLDTINIWLNGVEDGSYEPEAREDIRLILREQERKIKTGGKPPEELAKMNITVP